MTHGKEVENYIPVEVLREILDEPDLEEPGRSRTSSAWRSRVSVAHR